MRGCWQSGRQRDRSFSDNIRHVGTKSFYSPGPTDTRKFGVEDYPAGRNIYASKDWQIFGGVAGAVSRVTRDDLSRFSEAALRNLATNTHIYYNILICHGGDSHRVVVFFFFLYIRRYLHAQSSRYTYIIMYRYDISGKSARPIYTCIIYITLLLYI